MLFSLALIPSIVLLVYIYRKDKREKESFRLLFRCFIWGIIVIPAVFVIEKILGAIIDGIFIEGSIEYAVMEGFVVAAFTEELFKYLALRRKTWKSVEFNCSFDGIVYAVFVSLGFATFENVLYIFNYGDLSTALTRMFTAVPGHAYDGVFMGYFYSKAKKAEIDGDVRALANYKRLTLLVPIFSHGIYDCLISFDEAVVGEGVAILGIILWVIVVFIEFILALKLVRKASENDTELQD